jgi:23S rRNA (guanosine2251-2'-O)-methyltransferase
MDEIRERSRERGLRANVLPRQELDHIAPGNNQGVVAVVGEYRYASLGSILNEVAVGVLLADGIMDPQNLGALIRSALGAGFSGVIVPSHRAASVTSAARRVSAGASEILQVARVPNLSQAVEQAKGRGLWVVGLDDKASDSIWTSDLMDPPVALVIGAEDKGLSRIVRARCDGVVGIPQRGRLSSLNASVAGALAMFEVARRAASPSNSTFPGDRHPLVPAKDGR